MKQRGSRDSFAARRTSFRLPYHRWTARRLPRSPNEYNGRARPATERSEAHVQLAGTFATQQRQPGRRREDMKKSKNDASHKGESPSRLIDSRIKELGDWRGEMLSRIRSLIKQAVPAVTEEWKWRGVPVWYHDGMICTGETYKNLVKVTFAKGAQLKDPAKLFNSSLEGNVRRAIDLHQGDKVDDSAFKALFREAVALNTSARRG